MYGSKTGYLFVLVDIISDLQMFKPTPEFSFYVHLIEKQL